MRGRSAPWRGTGSDVRAIPGYALALAACLCCASGGAPAQDFPKRPVRLVLTFGAPGGSPDTIARVTGAKLSEMWGVQVVVDPRPGAGGMLATELVAKATPDGYTLVLVSPSHVINPSLHAKVAYDPFRDFAPITQAAVVPNILSVHPGVPARSVKELIALAKAKPGSLSYGSAGTGSSQHLAGELFREMAGVDIVHVPYKTANTANLDLIAGRIQVAFAATSSVNFIRDGRLVGLAVTSGRRSPAFPALPTIAEAGLPGYEAAAWYGVLAPTGVPRPVIAKLHRDFGTALAQPDVREKLVAQAIEAVTSATPGDFTKFLRREHDKWAALVRKSGARVD
jgi:tripartite-type tricarboxylate transporter receptor subunit TctC